jgi:hypothetical protein
METSDEKKQPGIEIRDDKGRSQRKYLLPSGAHLMVEDSATVSPSDVLAKIPRETAETKDITGGLPRWSSCSRRGGRRSRPSSSRSTGCRSEGFRFSGPRRRAKR